MTKTQDILDAVQVYLDAIYYCDVERLDQVFHDAASLIDADNDVIFVEPIASFREDVRSRKSPASQNQKRFDEIITIDWLSPLSATVKLRLHAMDNIFVDHLSFVQGPDGFQIVAKVWHLEATKPAIIEN